MESKVLSGVIEWSNPQGERLYLEAHNDVEEYILEISTYTKSNNTTSSYEKEIYSLKELLTFLTDNQFEPIN